ncbi:MAG: PaaI family thioesterase [Myxococcales bacterium]|nr:PaaI family thioesterase [Myxococcales bacterium]
MQVRNPNYKEDISELFSAAAFVSNTGIRLIDCGPGWVLSELSITEEHGQQDGAVHAGVQATMADHTAGAAATTLAEAGQRVLSIEFKINLLRMARGSALRCKAEVLKAGRTVSVVEASVFLDTGDGGFEVLVSKAVVTLALVDAAKAGGGHKAT